MSDLSKKGVLVTGRTIRIQRDGSGWQSEKHYVWVEPEQIPAEWEAVKSDPTVVSASLSSNARRSKRPGRGKELDHYQREQGGAA